jgi:signal transduction histidine kinase
VAILRQEFLCAPTERRKVSPVGDLPVIGDDLARLLAHDLKTPLAAISMNLDFALSELQSDVPQVLREALDDCREANARAVRIVSDMADAVRLISGDRRPILTEVDAAEVIAAAVETMASDAVARGVSMRFAAPRQLLVQADLELYTRALERTLERALRHARAGTAIEITLRARSIAVCVDAGAPCLEELPTYGLAWYFAEAAMRAQGGALCTEFDADGALTFRLSLPR